ncbi:Protein of unknown function [Quadrisphaera granulorum]|uniref:DUF2993 family protein n=1 Tax=Quadrisphaera granulorum TaxID=317664 RepID=A0A316A610_9ACTN|nr:DUF2993 domain-containing protein [Quadrisphaera granulorum]PWJ52922.1 Protein of unknown function (DUF2993) [Quadrisphaera granulorum]SZE97304.1 Protein of unknown function [Quadrisphaera granulorum]
MLRRLLLTLVVLAVLAGGAVVAAPVVDAGLRTAAEERVAAELVGSTGAAGAVDVSIRGGWFVPQAVRGQYDDVRVVARDVPAGDVVLSEVDARLTGVVLPLRQVLRGRIERVEVSRATSTALLTYSEVNAVLAQRDVPLGVPLTVSPDGDALRVTGSARVFGQQVSLSAEVDLTVDAGVDGSTVKAVPRQLDSGSALLDRLSRSVLGGLRDQLAFDVPLGPLPLSQQLTGVAVRADGLALSTTGSTIVVGS